MQSVSISSSVTSKTSPSDALTGPRCIARFDYEAGEPDDLDFVSGDVIRIIERVNDEWLRGELKGKTGVFPVAFVEIVEDLPFATSAEPQGNFDNIQSLFSLRKILLRPLQEKNPVFLYLRP